MNTLMSFMLRTGCRGLKCGLSISLNDTLTCTTLDLCYNDQANTHIILVILLNATSVIFHISQIIAVKFISIIIDQNRYHLDQK